MASSLDGIYAPRQDMVTASSLVRQFGLWQERAARGPVYIVHRGRPRLALIAVETLTKLVEPVADAEHGLADLRAVIANLPQAVLLASGDGTLLAASGRATMQLNLAATPPHVSDLPGAALARLPQAIVRVSTTGFADMVELPSPRDPGRRLEIQIIPAGSALLLVIADTTLHAELADERAQRMAEHAAIERAHGVALVGINARGHVEETSDRFAEMTGLSASTLSSARFALLFEVQARAAIGMTIEHLFAGAPPQDLEARLLVNRDDPVPVRIGMAAVRGSGTRVDGIRAAVSAFPEK